VFYTLLPEAEGGALFKLAGDGDVLAYGLDEVPNIIRVLDEWQVQVFP